MEKPHEKIEKIQDRLSTTQGFELKRLIESCRENHISNNLTLDKNMFQKEERLYLMSVLLTSMIYQF